VRYEDLDELMRGSQVLAGSRRHLFDRLLRYTSHDGQAWPSVDTLAAMLGMTPRNVQKALRDLEHEYGEIRRIGERVGGQIRPLPEDGVPVGGAGVTVVYEITRHPAALKNPVGSDTLSVAKTLSVATQNPVAVDQNPVGSDRGSSEVKKKDRTRTRARPGRKGTASHAPNQKAGRQVIRGARTCRRCDAPITNRQANNQSALCDECYEAHMGQLEGEPA
jgi:hypothetical protein